MKLNKPLSEFTHEELIDLRDHLDRLITGIREMIDAIKAAADPVLGLMELSFVFSNKGVSLSEFVDLAFKNLQSFMGSKSLLGHEISERSR